MAGNNVLLTFGGDSKSLEQAAKKAEKATEGVGDSANSAASDMDAGAQSATAYESRITAIGAGVSGMTDAVDSAGAAVQGLADLQNAGRDRAMKLARAQADVEQALLDQRQATIDLEQSVVDLTQAQADGRQAAIDEGQARIDAKQALLDQKAAQDDYNAAVKKYGPNSAEARQAEIDLSQAKLDHKQANEDLKQAQIDANQAVVDGKQYTLDGAQAIRDGKDAVLNYNDALHEANPSQLQKVADVIALATPLLSGLVGVVGLVTAAQWLWNTSLFASPITWIIAGIALLVGAIILIATKTDWFQKAWGWAWGGIKAAAQAVGDWFAGPFAGFFVGVWNKLRAAGQAVADWFSGPFIGFFTGAWGRMRAAGAAIGNWFTGPFANFFRRAWDRIKDATSSVVGWFRSVPGRIGGALSSVASAIFRPFRSAFNMISSAWNNTIGSLSFTFPSWIPGIGGNSISVPNLPKFHSGGRVPGGMHQEVLVALQGGEKISSTASSVGDTGWMALPRGDALLDTLLALLAERIDRKGGRASQLGIRVLS